MQTLVTFEEVTVCFTEEEWALLDAGQRALHSQIMEENRRTVASLGKECTVNPSQNSKVQLLAELRLSCVPASLTQLQPLLTNT
uniref:KRAB domain-containing protein n=1 Tax=Varanus komodoensis TaxID=61221 RepID=A0A8D2Q5A2_VARKO